MSVLSLAPQSLRAALAQQQQRSLANLTDSVLADLQQTLVRALSRRSTLEYKYIVARCEGSTEWSPGNNYM